MKDLLKYYIALQPKFREAGCNTSNTEWVWSEDYAVDKLYITFTPRTIDDSSEEARKRSLWGMFDVPPSVSFNSFTNKYICSLWDKQPMLIDRFVGETLTEAILKALCAQEGERK